MYCSQCGQKVPDNASYCSNCGNKLNVQSSWLNSTLNSNNIDFGAENNIISKQGLLYISGRRNRKPFICVHLALTLITYILAEIATTPYLADIVYFLLIIMLLMLAYMLAVNIGKRLQDVNMPGYIALALLFIGAVSIFTNYRDILGLVKFVISMLLIFLIFKKGTNGPNKYGEDPLNLDDM